MGMDDSMAAETPPLAEAPEVKGSGPQPMEQCVPIEALAMPEEGDQLANPEVGDQVSYTVEGKVTRIQGGSAYVMPESVNGKPVEEAGSEEQGATEQPASIEDEMGKYGSL